MIQKQINHQKVEILAPAGSYESFKAAIAAGADAVYAGGSRFGARAYAKNFTDALLLEAIDYAHLHGRKFYLTVNTLLKDSELDLLQGYLEPLYLGGLDAVIVQDLGVLDFVRNHFPEMDIHASTQMTITGPEGAEFLRKEGAVRVVPARELSLKEIRDMKSLTGMEIECFVHGALCYCYSGQCLLSSLIGGRSGNRGQCAQPCRLPYTINGDKKHWLSPKDICTLELIPDLVDAGIDSFKIEGRMKRPEYVAGVTSMYRKYVDLYLQKGRDGFRVTDSDKEALMDLYNRGGFNTGYYTQHNGRQMMSVKRPNHAGVPAVQVIAQKGREVTGNALTKIHKGDVLELGERQENYTFGTEYPKGSVVRLLAAKGQKLAVGSLLYRTKNPFLLDTLAKQYGEAKVKENIQGCLTLSVGQPAKLTVWFKEQNVEVYSEQTVEQAANSPLDEARIYKQMTKTGNTEFVFEHLDICIEGSVFLPMQQLNELRRNALEQLTAAVCEAQHRKKKTVDLKRIKENSGQKTKTEKLASDSMKLCVLVETLEQLLSILEFPEVNRVYVDSALHGDFLECTEALEVCRRIRGQGTEVFLAMPHIFREDTEMLFQKRYETILKDEFDGVLVRNLETLQFLKKCGFDRTVLLDHNLYVFNRYTKAFWEAYGADGFTLPLELNRSELKKLGTNSGELIVYGYLPVMVSAQCVTNTVSGCQKKEGIQVLTDRLGNQFTVRNHCRECYNVIYNSTPLFLLDQKEEFKELGYPDIRLQFSQENAKETRRILEMYRQLFTEEQELIELPDNYTRGHFKRGIL